MEERGLSSNDSTQRLVVASALQSVQQLPARGLDDVFYRVLLSIERYGDEAEKQRRRQILRGWRSCTAAMASVQGRQPKDESSPLVRLEEALRFELFNETPVGV